MEQTQTQKKRTRRLYPDWLKQAVCRNGLVCGLSLSRLAEEYGLPRSTVASWLQALRCPRKARKAKKV